jgi:ABC-type antimicrobial peptide transport system permease subunit
MQNKNMSASILFFFIGFVSMAQGGTPPPPMPPPPPGLPIDGGIVVLFVVALSFGIYKAYKISRETA